MDHNQMACHSTICPLVQQLSFYEGCTNVDSNFPLPSSTILWTDRVMLQVQVNRWKKVLLNTNLIDQSALCSASRYPHESWSSPKKSKSGAAKKRLRKGQHDLSARDTPTTVCPSMYFHYVCTFGVVTKSPNGRRILKFSCKSSRRTPGTKTPA